MKTWPSKAEVEEAMNDYPVEMVHEMADAVFSQITKLELTCLLASNALRQPRIIKMTATENLDMKDTAG